MDCAIRKATSKDATAISRIVTTTLRESNAQDYSAVAITAEAFYFSLGFRNVRDVFHGAERTLVMEKALGK